MRRILLVTICAIGLPVAVLAVEPAHLEVGTSFGVSTLFANGEDITTIGMPGAGHFLGAAALYMTAFPSPHFMLEPQVHLQMITSGGESYTVVSGMMQLGYLWLPEATGSPYFAVHGGGVSLSGDGADDGLGTLGASLGYRWRVGPGGALRLEGRYRRWFDEFSDLNELALTVGVGGIFR